MTGANFGGDTTTTGRIWWGYREKMHRISVFFCFGGWCQDAYSLRKYCSFQIREIMRTQNKFNRYDTTCSVNQVVTFQFGARGETRLWGFLLIESE